MMIKIWVVINSATGKAKRNVSTTCQLLAKLLDVFVSLVAYQQLHDVQIPRHAAMRQHILLFVWSFALSSSSISFLSRKDRQDLLFSPQLQRWHALGTCKNRGLACHFTDFHSRLLSKSRKMANQHCCFVIQGPTQRCPYCKWHDRNCPGNTSLQHVSFIRFRTKRNNHNHNNRVFAAYTLAATLTTQLQHTTTSLPLISSKPGTPVLLPFEHRTGTLPADHSDWFPGFDTGLAAQRILCALFHPQSTRL